MYGVCRSINVARESCICRAGNDGLRRIFLKAPPVMDTANLTPAAVDINTYSGTRKIGNASHTNPVATMLEPIIRLA